MAEVPFPELSPGKSESEVRVQMRVDDTAFTPGWSRTDEDLSYGYGGVARLWVNHEISLHRRPEVPVEVARLLVLGTGMALYAHRVGLPVLHGTTVRIEGSDLMLCGPSGVGKSSLTAALLRVGAVLVADDVGVIDEGSVRLGLPRIKLWDDAARGFGYDPDLLERVHPDFAKYSVPVEQVRTEMPLRTIVILRRGSAEVRRLRGGRALMAVVANHRVPEVLSSMESKRWMERVVELLRNVEVFELGLPGPLSELETSVRRLRAAVIGTS